MPLPDFGRHFRRAWQGLRYIRQHPLRAMAVALKHPLFGPMIGVSAFMALLGGIMEYGLSDQPTPTSQVVVNGEYVAPRNQLRWAMDGGPITSPSDLRSTVGACRPDISFVAHGLTKGGQYSVAIKGYYLDSGWVDTVDELDNAVVTLNCFAYPQGDYTLEITDLTTKRVITFKIASERKNN